MGVRQRSAVDGGRWTKPKLLFADEVIQSDYALQTFEEGSVSSDSTKPIGDMYSLAAGPLELGDCRIWDDLFGDRDGDKVPSWLDKFDNFDDTKTVSDPFGGTYAYSHTTPDGDHIFGSFNDDRQLVGYFMAVIEYNSSTSYGLPPFFGESWGHSVTFRRVDMDN